MQFCIQERLELDVVFADNGVDDLSMIRPGFEALMDSVAATSATQAVVVPALNHLSSDAFVLTELRLRLSRAGASLQIIHTSGPF